mmetsp:Transcript_22230/g.37758  ORF Transcript_22230/g.37758 Transcript_22230/m.37758 type:complete len:318 (+) Transcript_22230:1621-2574(+)
MIPNHLEHCIPAISRMVTHEGVRDEQESEGLGGVAEGEEAVRDALGVLGHGAFVVDEGRNGKEHRNRVADGVGGGVQLLDLVLFLEFLANLLQLLGKLRLGHRRDVAHHHFVLQLLLGLHQLLGHLRTTALDQPKGIRVRVQVRVDHGVQGRVHEDEREQPAGGDLPHLEPEWLVRRRRRAAGLRLRDFLGFRQCDRLLSILHVSGGGEGSLLFGPCEEVADHVPLPLPGPVSAFRCLPRRGRHGDRRLALHLVAQAEAQQEDQRGQHTPHPHPHRGGDHGRCGLHRGDGWRARGPRHCDRLRGPRWLRGGRLRGIP